MQIAGHGLHPYVEKAMGHRRIQHSCDGAAVQHTGVSLEPLVGAEASPYAVVGIGLECEPQGKEIFLTAKQTAIVTVC